MFVFSRGKTESDDRLSIYVLFGTMSAIPLGIRWGVADDMRDVGLIPWGFPYVGCTGFALVGLGLSIHLAGMLALGKWWSPSVVIADDHLLVETGIYRFIRHPIYSGILLTLLGFGLALSNWLSIAVLILPNAAGIAYRIHVEEQALRRHFGAAYDSYAKRTKRLIPGVF